LAVNRKKLVQMGIKHAPTKYSGYEFSAELFTNSNARGIAGDRAKDACTL
jgi:hypothetical protein